MAKKKNPTYQEIVEFNKKNNLVYVKPEKSNTSQNAKPFAENRPTKASNKVSAGAGGNTSSASSPSKKAPNRILGRDAANMTKAQQSKLRASGVPAKGIADKRYEIPSKNKPAAAKPAAPSAAKKTDTRSGQNISGLTKAEQSKIRKDTKPEDIRNTIPDRRTYTQPEEFQGRKGNLYDNTVGSFQRGIVQSDYGQELHRQMLGKDNKVAQYEKQLSGDTFDFQPEGAIAKAVSQTAEFLGQQVNQLSDWKSVGTALTAGGAAFMLGQVGPQIATPEELVTVPLAFGTGLKTGASAVNFEVESGFAYKEMIENGISPETAKNIALGVGGANAALEYLQLDELAKGYKVLAKSPARGTEFTRKLGEILKQYGMSTATETAQELMQESVTMGGANLANELEGKPLYSNEEILDRLKETAGSALAFGVMGGPGAAMQVNHLRKGVSEMGRNINNMGITKDVIESGLESDEKTSSYKKAQKAKEMLSQGRELSEFSLGNLHLANIEAINAENDIAQRENIATYLTFSGVNSNAAQPIAAVLQKAFVGDPLSNNDAETIINNQTAREMFEGATGIVISNGTMSQMRKDVKQFSIDILNGRRQPIYYDMEPANTAQVEKNMPAADIPIQNNINAQENTNIAEMGQNFAQTDSLRIAAEQFYRNMGETQIPFDKISEQAFEAVNPDLKVKAYFDGVAMSNQRMGAKRLKGDKNGGLVNRDVKGIPKKTIQAIDNLGKAAGVKIEIVDAIFTKSGAEANGSYENGVIKISRNADKPLIEVLRHEITHALKKTAPAEYEKYKNFVISAMIEKEGTDFDTIVAKYDSLYSENGEELEYDEVVEEIVSDFTKVILKDQKFIKKMAKEETSTFKKLLKMLSDFIKKLSGNRAIVNEYGFDLEELKQAEQMWLEALESVEKEDKSVDNSSLKEGKPKMMFMGQKAENANLKMLEQAKLMEADGIRMEIIKKDTGWMKGLDKKWKFEISDKYRYFVGSKKSTTRKLSEIFDHEKLYDNYPELEDLTVEFANIGSYSGAYDDSKKTISINTMRSEEDQESTLLHEIQHAIQSIEGFEEGSNTDMAKMDKDEMLDDIRDDISYKRSEINSFLLDIPGFVAERSELSQKFKRDEITEEEYIQLIKTFVKNAGFEAKLNQLNEELDELKAKEKAIKDGDLHNMYLNNAGEIEARTTQLRRDYNQEGIDTIYPYTDSDISKATGKFSIKDSAGKQLSQKQQEFFKDSKVRDENGSLKVMYHGTPSGEFDEFKLPKYLSSMMSAQGAGFYFTDEKNAKQYMKPVNKSGSAKNSKLLKAYLNIKDPLIVTAGSRNITKDQIKSIVSKGNYEWFLTSGVYNQSGTDKSRPASEAIEAWVEHLSTLKDERILSEITKAFEGEDNTILEAMSEVFGKDGLKYTDRFGEIWVAWKPEQIKTIDNENPTEDARMKFSKKNDLIAIHNTIQEDFIKTLKLGGIPVPSIAVVKAEMGHGEFGEISVLFHPDAIDGKKSKANKVFTGDAWTQTFPNISPKVNERVYNSLEKKIESLLPDLRDYRDVGYLDFRYDEVQDKIERHGSFADAYFSSDIMRLAFLRDTGKEFKPAMKDRTFMHDRKVMDSMLKMVGVDKVNESMDRDEMMSYEPQIRDAINKYYESLSPGTKRFSKEMTWTQMDNTIGALREYAYHLEQGAPKVIDSVKTREKIDKAVNKNVYRKWLEDISEGIIEKYGIRNNKDLYTNNGRRSWDQLYVAPTLENITRSMISKDVVGNAYGDTKFISGVKKELTSVADIRKHKEILKNVTDEEIAEIRKSITGRLLDIVNRIRVHKQGREDMFYTDYVIDEIVEHVREGRTRAGIERKLKTTKYGNIDTSKITDEVMDDLMQLIEDAQTIPTRYFEAKPQRAVGLDEIKRVVLPRKGTKELRAMLDNLNIPYVTYDGTEEDRLNKINAVDEVKFSRKSMRHDLDETTMMQDLVKHGVFTQGEADVFRQNIEELLGTISANVAILDMNETTGKDDRLYMPYKPNSDDLYKVSLDYSTLCRKRIISQLIVEALQVELGKAIPAEEQLAINRKLQTYKDELGRIEVACAVCYVESARLKSPEQINRFIDNRTEYMTDYFAKRNKEYFNYVDDLAQKEKVKLGYGPKATKSQMKGKDYDQVTALKQSLNRQYKPSPEEQKIIDAAESLPAKSFLSAENLDWLNRNHREIFNAFTARIREATKSKALETHIAYYYGDSRVTAAEVTDTLIKNMNAENGLRTQSWSDFQMIHLLDTITSVIEMSMRGAKMHGYSKVPDFVRLMGHTGLMINMSLIPLGKTGFDENGNLVFSPQQGMDYLEMRELRGMFPQTAGNIALGINNDQIKAMMKDEEIDFIIPYHMSGLKEEFRNIVGIGEWENFQDFQKEAKNPEFKGKIGNAPKFSEWFTPEEGKTGIEIMRNSAEKYKKLCFERGLIPKFPMFQNEKDYWKVLVDRKMINQVTGEIIIQEAVKPIFDFKEINAMLKREVDSYNPELREAVVQEVIKAYHSGEIAQIAKTPEIIQLFDRLNEMSDTAIIGMAAPGAPKHSIKKPGYHAGDLGKAESYATMDSGRGTGHFGTGTYFVGSKENLDLDAYNGRPLHEIETADYNLYTPKSHEQAMRLHDFLRDINRYLLSMNHDIRSESDIRRLRDDAEDALRDYYNAEGDETAVDEATAKMDAIFNKYVSEETRDRFEHYKNDLDTEWKYYEEMIKELMDDSYYSKMNNHRRRIEWMDNLRSEGLVLFGIEGSKTKKLLNEVLKEYTQMFPEGKYANREKAKNTDSLSTAFMKKLGYEGVDVTGIKEMDNTKYGSVIYDLKPEGEADQIRYSFKGQSDIVRRNRILQEQNEKLKNQMRLTQKPQISEAKSRQYVNEMLRAYGSRHKAAVEEIQALYTDMMADDVIYEDMRARAQEIASRILEDSYFLNKEDAETYRGLINNMKVNGVSISKEYVADIMGGLSEFKKKNRGLRIADDATPVDTVYMMLLEEYPELFNEDVTHPADQLLEIAVVLKKLQPSLENPYSPYMEEATQFLANEILDNFFDIPQQKPTFADKKQAQMTRERIRSSEKIASLKEENREKIYTLIKLERDKRNNSFSSLLTDLKRIETGDEEIDNLDWILKQNFENMDFTKEEKQTLRKLKNLLEKDHKKTLNTAKKDAVQKARERQDYVEWWKRNLAKLEHREALKEKVAHEREKTKKRARLKRIKENVKQLQTMLLSPTDQRHIPEVLRKPVAEFLDSLDFTNSRQKEGTRNRIESLHLAYLKIMVDDINGVSQEYFDIAPDTIELMAELSKTVADKKVVDMNASEIEILYKIVISMKHLVANYNKLLATAHKENVSDYAMGVITDAALKQTKKERVNTLARSIDGMLNYDMLAPLDYFTELGHTMQMLYQNLRRGLDKKLENTRTIEAYMHNLLDGVDIKTWTGDGAELHHFNFESGDSIDLTTAQIMSLYLLSQREQALLHIYVGGISQGETVVKDKYGRVTVKSTSPAKITPEELVEITSKLTEEQRKVAKGIQAFLQDHTSEWGNEVSMKLFGYKKFGEENYFPIKSNDNYLSTQYGMQYEANLRNAGFTKSTIKGANNPIMIEDVFDIFTTTADKMGSYNAFVLPLSDLQKVMNYKDEDGSVKQAIERAFGKKGLEYFKKLMVDVNGGVRTEAGTELLRKLLANYKAAAMGLNLRVIIQQPTAIVRASAMIDPKYLIQGILKKSDYNTVLENSPIAKWKSYGYFNLDIGRQLKDVFIGKKYLSDSFFAAISKADDLAWGKLWNAVELETQDKYSQYEVGSPQYWQVVSLRFSDIVDKTQVVDTVLHRTQIMRSHDNLAKIYTSFMAEPMKSFNLLRTSILKAREYPTAENKKQAARSVAAWAAAVAVNSAVVSLIDMYRKADDDDEWIDQYLRFLAANASNDLSGMIPVFKDIASLMNGYAPKRMELEGFNDAAAAVKKLSGYMTAMANGEAPQHSIAYIMKDASSAAGKLLGIPVANVIRELEAIGKNALNWADKNEMNYAATKMFFNIANSDNKKKYYDILYKSMMDGNEEETTRIYNDMLVNGFKASEVENAMNSRTRRVLEGSADIAEMGDKLSRYKNMSSEEKKSFQQEFRQAAAKLKERGFTADQIKAAVKKSAKGSTKSDAPTVRQLYKVYKEALKDESRKKEFMQMYNKMLDSGYKEDDIKAGFKALKASE